jgi:hypothetical protein
LRKEDHESKGSLDYKTKPCQKERKGERERKELKFNYTRHISSAE